MSEGYPFKQNLGEIRAAIATKLQEDSELLSLLPQNVNWQTKDDPSQENSVMPMAGLNAKNSKNYKYPVVTIQTGTDVYFSDRLISTFIWVRCYNSSDSSYVLIDEVLSRVIDLLHLGKLDLQDNVQIKLAHAGTTAEQLDQGYNLPYREAQFQLQRI